MLNILAIKILSFALLCLKVKYIISLRNIKTDYTFLNIAYYSV